MFCRFVIRYCITHYIHKKKNMYLSMTIARNLIIKNWPVLMYIVDLSNFAPPENHRTSYTCPDTIIRYYV